MQVQEPEDDLHHDAKGLEIDRPLRRRPREELAARDRAKEENSRHEWHEQGREYPRRQAPEVGEEALEAQEAQESNPHGDGEHDAAWMPAGAEPPRQRAEEHGDLDEENDVSETLHLSRALKPRSAAAESPAALPKTDPAMSPAPPG